MVLNEAEEISDEGVDSRAAREMPSSKTTLYHAARTLRQELLSLEKTMPCTPSTNDIMTEKCKQLVPDFLYKFLLWLFYGDSSPSGDSVDNSGKCPGSVEQKKMSI